MTALLNKRKKVAIMTIFQVPNYGSVLQAFATQLFFEKLGFSCEIINYKYPNSWHYGHGTTKHRDPIILKILKQVSMLFGISKYHRFRKRLHSFKKKYLKFTPRFDSLESLSNGDWNDFECIIAGSDQIWNYRFTLGDSAFMLSFVPDGIKKISFASSFASDHLPDNYVEKYRSELKRFLFIGVREENGISIIRNQLGLSSDSAVILDPTLLISQNEWIEKMQLSYYSKKTPYILLYVLEYAFDPYPYILEIAKYFSKKLNLPIKVSAGKRNILKKHIASYDDCTTSSPREFLNLIRQADLVITSSFHGTAFSINFERPLIAVTPANGDDRQSSLLRSLEIESCRAVVGQPMTSINPYYDFEKSANILSTIRKEQYVVYKKILTK